MTGMIVPRTRLILWTAGVVLAVYGARRDRAGFAGDRGLFSLSIFFAVAIADAFFAPSRFEGIEVELPGLVRLQKDRVGPLALRIHNRSARAQVLRIGLAFPREIVSDASDCTVDLPAGATLSRMECACTPTVRGQYFLRAVQLEVQSPLGLWSCRRGVPSQMELRVYPNLLTERRNVAALFLRRADFGIHAQRLAGQGREFEKLRDFVSGDSLSDIHWKASAKRGKPVTKIHQIERSHEVYVIIDASRLSARKVVPEKIAALPAGATGESKSEVDLQASALERYVTAALIVALAAERQGDQFGLITFSDRILNFVRARSGQSHFDACRDQLYGLQAQTVSPDFEELFTFVRLRLRKRALLIVLTALDDPVVAESFTKSVELVSRQHLLLVDMLRPPGAGPLFEERAPVARVDDLYTRLAGHLRWQELRELQKVLQRRGVRLFFLDSETISADLVAQHADVRARQLI